MIITIITAITMMRMMMRRATEEEIMSAVLFTRVPVTIHAHDGGRYISIVKERVALGWAGRHGRIARRICFP
jgi:hypothetical protein